MKAPRTPLRVRWRAVRALLRMRRHPPAIRPLALGDVTIVVLNWNGREVTLACLASLAQAKLGGATVLVVDNGSRDGSAEAIRARFPNVRILPLPENRGYAGGNNAGIRWALEHDAGAVLLLNNDTRVERNFLAPLVELLNNNPRAAAVSSAILRYDSPQALTEAWLELYFGYGLVRRVGVNGMPGEGYDSIRQVDVALGCSWILRREALEEIGLLDEAYFAYHEDVDWCTRAGKAALLVYYHPFSRVWHHRSKSTDQARRARRQRPVPGRGELANTLPLTWNPARTYLGARNSIRFVRTHAHALRKLRFVVSVAYALPLQLLALVADREEDYAIGKLGYAGALAWYCLESGGAPRETWTRGRPSFGQCVRALGHAPRTLLRRLPADVRRALEDGRGEELVECVRGYRDGWRDVPLPLARLGLR
jgi:GT2 family glycosyltransferase